MDNCNINLGAVKAKEIDGELYISCWNFSKALSEKEREISDLCKGNDELRKQISELESELAVKEDLLKIKNGLCDEEPLPFSCDACSECYEADLQELQHTHLKDRMTISKLKIAIGVLTEQYAELREEKGLTDTQS